MSEPGFNWGRLCSDGNCLCPVCGFSGYFAEDAFDEHGGLIANGVCPCCLFEPGMTDNPTQNPGFRSTLECVRDFRMRWLQRGKHWPEDRAILWRSDKSRYPPPADWSPDQQLERLFSIAPELK